MNLTFREKYEQGKQEYTNLKHHGKDGNGWDVYSGDYHATRTGARHKAAIVVDHAKGRLVASHVGTGVEHAAAEHAVKTKATRYWDDKEKHKSWYLHHHFETTLESAPLNFANLLSEARKGSGSLLKKQDDQIAAKNSKEQQLNKKTAEANAQMAPQTLDPKVLAALLTQEGFTEIKGKEAWSAAITKKLGPKASWHVRGDFQKPTLSHAMSGDKWVGSYDNEQDVGHIVEGETPNVQTTNGAADLTQPFMRKLSRLDRHSRKKYWKDKKPKFMKRKMFESYDMGGLHLHHVGSSDFGTMYARGKTFDNTKDAVLHHASVVKHFEGKGFVQKHELTKTTELGHTTTYAHADGSRVHIGYEKDAPDSNLRHVNVTLNLVHKKA